MFSIKNLTYQYNQKIILDIKAWDSQQGEQWLLLGNSGSGKTTLLHILGGILSAKNGEITIAKQNLKQLNGAKLDKFRAKNIGLIFQKPHLMATLSVMQNLLLAQYLAGVKQDTKHCEAVLSQLNILDKRKSKPFQLSQGEAQRVSVARAIINHPQLILADEPTASLDDTNAKEVIQLLQTQAKNYQATLVIATHDFRVKAQFEKQFVL